MFSANLMNSSVRMNMFTSSNRISLDNNTYRTRAQMFDITKEISTVSFWIENKSILIGFFLMLSFDTHMRFETTL